MLWKEVSVRELDELIKFVRRANDLIDKRAARWNFNSVDFGSGFETFSGLELSQTGIVRVDAGQTLQIHIDGSAEVNRWALNVPLRHCEGSLTKFWCTDKSPVLKKHKGGEYWHVDGPYTLMGEFCLRTTTLINISVPHSVENLKPTDRYALSLRFKDSPSKFLDQ
jgi:hypothetical protein